MTNEAAAVMTDSTPTPTPRKLMTVSEIAWVCHEANRAYCKAINDGFDGPPWENASTTLKASAISGVQFYLDHPEATAADQHQQWMDFKSSPEGGGWVYGPVKDANAEPPTHPDLVPQDQLPIAQQRKDDLFRAVVHALAF